METIPHRSKTEYIPGVCNIGLAEKRVRRNFGWAGVGLTIGLWGAFALGHTPQLWRLLVFLPASMAATGFLQAALNFCAGFGMKGVYNFQLTVGKTEEVTQAEHKQKDRQKSLLIMLYSALIGLAAAAAAFFIEI